MTAAAQPGLRVLLLGSGGREHALAWKISQSPLLAALAVLPGSDAMNGLPHTQRLAGNAADAKTVVAAAHDFRPDLVIIGPETPLAAGVSDALSAAGFAVAAPSRAAARLESSKIFSKNFMTAAGIPTAAFTVCDSHAEAQAAAEKWDIEKDGIVIKADGLAAGKGVVVTHDRAEALRTLHDFMLNPDCAVKSDSILLEQKITGREVSAFALCDGKGFISLGYACDYKRLRDGDKGPNTGGMGGFAPETWPSPAARQFIEENVFKRTVDAMAAAGTPFTGVLFAGLMVDGNDVKVIEFNTRFGDPEAQILLPLIEDDILPLFAAAAAGTLAGLPPVRRRQGTAVHVVMVSEGYPEIYGTGMRTGENIDLPQDLLQPQANDAPLLFIAGATIDNGQWRNAGGRVLGVTATGDTLETARRKAYDALGGIRFNGAHWRTDIGA